MLHIDFGLHFVCILVNKTKRLQNIEDCNTFSAAQGQKKKYY